MLVWFAGASFALVVNVFRDAAIDYRLVMLGALLPDLVDGPLGGARVLHSVLASAVLLAAVMLATRGKRSRRRQLLAIPIGTFAHLVLDAAWARTHVFWWPFFGWSFEGAGLPSFDRPVMVVAVQEAVGLLALRWAWRRFRLGEPHRWQAFRTTGRLSRELMP